MSTRQSAAPDSSKQITIHVAVSGDLHTALTRAAKERRVTRSVLVRELLALGLGDEALAEMAPAHRPRAESE